MELGFGPMGLAENLKRLRTAARLSQPELARKAGVSQQLISQLENDKHGSTKNLPKIAHALGVAVSEIDENYTPETAGPPPVDVPHLSWVSAGALMHDDVQDEALGTIRVNDLPKGDWIALTVEGTSMDRISPPGSVIFVDRRDKTLVDNGLYVIDDGEGNATYKRFRRTPTRFEPVSTDLTHETIFPDHEPNVVGRVKRSVLDTM